jgi:hypothetical protein
MIVPHFLLIQGGEVIDHADRPCRLIGSYVWSDEHWLVAAGCINEFGEREIVGIVAKVCPILSSMHSIRITSEMDGDFVLIDNYPTIHDIVVGRLDSMYCRGRFRDLANLPQPIIVTPVRRALSASP